MKSISLLCRSLSRAVLAFHLATLIGLHADREPTVCAPVLPGLVGWWPGTSDATDEVGNHDGTVNHGTTFAAGKVGTAFSFDGVNEGVVIPGFLAKLPPSEITIEFWQKVSGARIQSTFRQANFSAGSICNAHVPYVDGVVYWDFGDITAGGRLNYTPPVSIVGTWQHFALVASQSGNYMRIYRNGVLEASKNGMTPLIRINEDWLLGGVAGLSCAGLLDELSIYDRALSGPEILAIYQADSAGKCDLSPRVVWTTPTPDGSTLSWEAPTGLSSRFTYRDDLADAQWLSLDGDLTAASGTVSKMDTTLGAALRRVYRLIQEPTFKTGRGPDFVEYHPGVGLDGPDWKHRDYFNRRDRIP